MPTSAVMNCESTRVIQLETEAFRENFNKRWFPLEHALARHPLFELDRLIALAKQTEKDRSHDLHFDKGATSVGQRWSETPACDLPIDETIRRLEHEGAWIVLKHAELDREYTSILERTIAEVHELAGPPPRKRVKLQEIIQFYAPPNGWTTHHNDS